MAPRPRNKDNRDLPLNVYRNRNAYVWKHPVTWEVFGLGSNRQEAFAQAHEANIAVLGLLEKPRLVHRIAGAPETLADWIETYKGIISTRLEKKKIAASTAKTFTQRCTVIAAAIGELVLKNISTRTIATFLQTYDSKERMQQALRSLLLDIFREAIMAGWCESNPVEITKTQEVHTKRGRLTLDQFVAIHARALEVGPAWVPHALELALLTGQRRGDIAKMKYRDIKDGCLSVAQQKNKQTDLVGHNVAIPLGISIAGFSLQDTIAKTRNVVSQFLVHHAAQNGYTKVGSKIRDESLTKEFASHRDYLGIGGEAPPTLHEIRSLAARLYGEKYGKEFAQALLGHKSDKMAALYRDERDGWFRPQIAK